MRCNNRSLRECLIQRSAEAVYHLMLNGAHRTLKSRAAIKPVERGTFSSALSSIVSGKELSHRELLELFNKIDTDKGEINRGNNPFYRGNNLFKGEITFFKGEITFSALDP